MNTADLCDEYPESVTPVLPIGFRDFGGKRNFSGRVHTVKCFEDNSIVRKALEKNGKGKVLIIDGGGSLRCALMGDMLGQMAVKNEWTGVILYGCVRDSVKLSEIDLGVKALNTNPLKSNKRNEGQENIQVSFGGVMFSPGDFVYCDADGIVVSKELL